VHVGSWVVGSRLDRGNGRPGLTQLYGPAVRRKRILSSWR
jgi:hypothetical protein